MVTKIDTVIVIMQANQSGNNGATGVSVHSNVPVAFSLENGSVNGTRSVLSDAKVKDGRVSAASLGVVNVSGNPLLFFIILFSCGLNSIHLT